LYPQLLVIVKKYSQTLMRNLTTHTS